MEREGKEGLKRRRQGEGMRVSATRGEQRVHQSQRGDERTDEETEGVRNTGRRGSGACVRNSYRANRVDRAGQSAIVYFCGGITRARFIDYIRLIIQISTAGSLLALFFRALFADASYRSPPVFALFSMWDSVIGISGVSVAGYRCVFRLSIHGSMVTIER